MPGWRDDVNDPKQNSLNRKLLHCERHARPCGLNAKQTPLLKNGYSLVRDAGRSSQRRSGFLVGGLISNCINGIGLDAADFVLAQPIHIVRFDTRGHL